MKHILPNKFLIGLKYCNIQNFPVYQRLLLNIKNEFNTALNWKQ